MLKGQRTIQVARDGVVTNHTAMANELMITYPFELHQTSGLVKTRHEFFAFQLNVRNHTPLLGLNDEYSELLRSELQNLENRHLKVGNSQIALLRTAFNLIVYGNESDRCSGVAYLTCFLFGLKYLEPIFQTDTKPVSEEIRRAVTYIADNLYQPLPLEEVAEVSGYSLSHFKFKFREYFGISPAEYISIQKITAAEKELLSTDISITDLAFKYGFSSSNYFCTVFKKVLGFTPSRYRSQFKEKESSQKLHLATPL
jgi:AraC-like DNA-binding protein